jgi:hypothetical protein
LCAPCAAAGVGWASGALFDAKDMEAAKKAEAERLLKLEDSPDLPLVRACSSDALQHSQAYSRV